MDHDYTLEELLGILRIVAMVKCSTTEDKHLDAWCNKHVSCAQCNLALADAIERKAREEWQRGYDEGFASADDWCAEHEDAMAEHGWVRLPVDADGVPIRVGDELTEVELRRRGGKPAEVVCILYNDDGCVVSSSDPSGFFYDPSTLTHKLPPTVEDVLREFVTEFNRDDSELCDGEIIERFAKRLRLADKED